MKNSSPFVRKLLAKIGDFSQKRGAASYLWLCIMETLSLLSADHLQKVGNYTGHYTGCYVICAVMCTTVYCVLLHGFIDPG